VRIVGAPVYIHWSALVVIAAIFLFSLSSPIYGAIAVASYLGIIVVHEIGHAIVAMKLKYGVTAIKIGAVHGLCEYEEPYSEWEDVIIAWGGVAAQVVVALFVLTIAALYTGDSYGYFGPVVAFLGYINLVIAAVNLAPSPWLDGYKTWRIVPLLEGRSRAR